VVAAARKRVGAACRRHGKFAMSARLAEPLSDLVAEGYRVMGVGADVLGLTAYVHQRLQVVQGHIDGLPAALKPSARSVYA
jgi:4-hydroxy-2-oxoheptanedioate aldolase